MDINFWAGLLAAASSFLLGGLWYSPMLFLKPWRAAVGRREEHKAHPGRVFGLSFVVALISASACARLPGPEPRLTESLKTGLIVRLGLVGMGVGINCQFAKRPLSALFFDGGYHTGQFVLYGLIPGARH